MSRVAIITGASRSIGAATARLLSERGFQVVVNYRSSAEEAEEVVADITAAGGEALAIKADVAWLWASALSHRRAVAPSA